MIQKLLHHLMETSYSFYWFEIYAYWGLVILIFVVDNILRHKYIKKLNEENKTYKNEMNHKLDVMLRTNEELRVQNKMLISKHGRAQSLMDNQDYDICVRSFSYGKQNKQKMDHYYKSSDLKNFPTIKEK